MTNIKKISNTSILIILVSALIISNIDLFPLNTDTTSQSTIDSPIIGKLDIPNQSYSTNTFGTGKSDLNVTLHQSYEASGDLLFEITEFNNEYNRTFQANSPKDANFNSTFTNITIQDIYAPDYVLTVEDVYDGRQLVNTRTYGSFKVNSDCNVGNLSIQVRNNGGQERYDINIYNASWDGSNLLEEPDDDLNGIATDLDSIIVPDTGLSNIWVYTTYIDFAIDVSNTINNTFFVSVRNFNSIGEWIYENDDPSDDSLTYIGPTYTDQDQNLKLNLTLSDNTPQPESIGLKINGTKVDNIGNENIGKWTSENGEFSSSNGELNFTVSADWWDVQLNITKIIVNYTKDLQGTANYFVKQSGADIQWNITLPSAVDDFRSNLNYYYINYTIPDNWDDATIKIYNNTIEWVGVNSRSLGNRWREVNTPNAGNGTWILSCNSTNLLSSIDMFIQGTTNLITQASPSSNVVFNATFSIPIATDDGNINLTVYNPDSLNNFLNYTDQITSFSSGTNITTTTWDVDTTVIGAILQPLEFRVQMWWNNGTSAGFLERNITLIQELATDIELPVTHRNVPRGFIANYTFNYTRESDSSPITNGYIVKDYLHADLAWSYTNEGNGNYTVHIDTDNMKNINLDTVFDANFTIQAITRQAIKINLTINITMPRTEMVSITSNLVSEVIATGLNITLNFTLNDAEKGTPISTLTTQNISVEDIENLGVQWDRDDPDFPNEGYFLHNLGNGKYRLNISTLGLTEKNSYTLQINISYTSSNPGEYQSLIYDLTFYYGSKPSTPGAVPGSGGSSSGGGGGTTITGMPYELLILIVILTVVSVAGSVITLVVYKKTIVPRKEAKERERAEVMSIFDDALNIEHVFILYSETGGCIFNRTFRKEEVDSQLIGGFLSAVSLFAKEFSTEDDPLGEIEYQNRHVLMGDGNYVRIALILEKKASKYLRQHLTLFVGAFEQEYKEQLEEWRGQINIFENAQELMDDYLNMSILRRHYIQREPDRIKKLTNPLSRDLLKVAEKLAKKNKETFRISDLLTEGERQLKKGIEDIWVGVKELRDVRIFVPIEFVEVTPKPITTEEELQNIYQKIATLPLSDDEQKALVKTLSSMNVAERETYIKSIESPHELETVPVDTSRGVKIIPDLKTAKNEIKALRALAKKATKKQDLEKSLRLLMKSSTIAQNWELKVMQEEIELQRIDVIKQGYLGNKFICEQEGDVAVQRGHYQEAVNKYKMAAECAHKVFKLGENDMLKEIKRLERKAMKYEKYI